jgi:hypothetical protein
MTLTDLGSLAIGSLLMFLIMAMVGIDNVGELADLVLEMDGSDLRIMQLGIYWLSLAWALYDFVRVIDTFEFFTKRLHLGRDLSSLLKSVNGGASH